LKKATISKWVQQRRITYVKLGHRVLIPESEIQRLIEANTFPALPEQEVAVS
jgi:excisionase family DNA binding protein